MKTKSEISEEKRDFSLSQASQSEEAFVRGLVNREEGAYRELVEGWADKLYRMVFRFLRRPEEAQEVVQEIFQKVVEKIHTFQGDSKFSTWLYRVAVNEALMRIRSNKGKKDISWDEVLPHFEDGVWAASPTDWSKLPDQQLMEREVQEFIRHNIDELPEDYRAPYLLKDVEELSEEEVCESLGLTKPVMKMRVHRARLFLRKKLEEKFLKERNVR